MIQIKNTENQEIHRIQQQNNGNHEKLIFPIHNHENHEIHRIHCQNQENYEHLIVP